MLNHCKLIKDTFEIQNGQKVYDFHKCLDFIDYQGNTHYGHNFRINILDIPTIYKLVIYMIKDQNTALKEQIDLNKGPFYYRVQLVAVKPQLCTSSDHLQVLCLIIKSKPVGNFPSNLLKVAMMPSTNTP